MAWQARNSKGVAYIVALLFLAIFTVLATAFAASYTSNLHQANNRMMVDTARLQAESGLSYLTYHLSRLSVPSGKTGQDLLDIMAQGLASRLNGTPNLNGASVTYDGSTIAVPVIATGTHGRGFSILIRLVSASAVSACVTGTDDAVSRSIGMDFTLAAARSAVFDFGVASKSAIQLTGNASVKGANNAAEANILSATFSTNQVYDFNGNTEIAGDISASNPDAYASMTGNIKIGGVSASDPSIADHIHFGVGDVQFPEVDPSPYEPYATTIVDSHTSVVGNKTFTNIRIKAGTNPTFAGNITIKGILFIETPNKVKFTGNLNFTGVIVTQDAGDGHLADNKIDFAGNSSFLPVESLPSQPEFTGLKDMPGSFLLAPGFAVSFAGNFGTIGGTIAADSFSWVGNASGTVKGTVINYGDTVFSMTGNSKITIDKSSGNNDPPGFFKPAKLSPNPDSYVEY